MTAEPGPVGEEAARLVEALAQWARGQFGDSLGEQLRDNIATDSAECKLCPVCMLIGIVRGTRPETVEHLLDAANSLTAAMRSAMATHGASHEHGTAHAQHWASRRTGSVEHIDVD